MNSVWWQMNCDFMFRTMESFVGVVRGDKPFNYIRAREDYRAMYLMGGEL